MADGLLNLLHFEPLWRRLHFPGPPAYAVYETRDRHWIALGNLEPGFWSAFWRALGREDIPARTPRPGEHTDALLRELGYAQEAITQLRQAGAIA